MKLDAAKNGFTMVELVITISILSFGIIGLYSAFLPLFGLTNSISNRFTASYLAQDAFETVRNLRDNNFIASFSYSNGLLGCDEGVGGCELDYKTGTTAEGPEDVLQLYGQGRFLRISPDNFYGYSIDPSSKETVFKRKITITEEEDNVAMKVLVEVFWNHNNKSYEFETEGYLYNWNE